MTNLQYGRALFGQSMGFHVIFAFLGVGLPLFVSLFEALGIKTGNLNYTIFARRLAYGLVMVFVLGAISGMAVSTQLSTLWPGFMRLMSQVDILPFVLEGIAFFVEAIFLGIYVYGWHRFKNPWLHWLTSLPVILGSAASAYFITAGNAFIHTPAGFSVVHGQLTNIHPLVALFNPSTAPETMHVLASSYLNTALALAALYAVYSAWHPEKYFKQILHICMLGVFVFALLTALSGDHQGKFLAQQKPLELAAEEAHFNTESNAPLELGGIVTQDGVLHALTIPSLLSFLSFGTLSHPVVGLLDFPKSTWPPLYIHYTFDLMVSLGIAYVTYAFFYLFLYWRKSWWLLYSKVNLYFLALLGLSSFLAVDAGWETVEAGRLPWIVYDVMQVKDAFTTSPYVVSMYYLFLGTFAALFLALILLLIFFFKRRPISVDGSIT